MTTPLCPICKRALADGPEAASGPEAARFKPFCSKRCADVDLARWFTGNYAIPVVEPDEDEEPEGSSSDEDGEKPIH